MNERNKALVATNIGMWVMQGLYTASPIDLIPDILPFLGWFDDALGLMVTIAFTVYTISIIRKHGLHGLLPARRDPQATADPDTLAIDTTATTVASDAEPGFGGYEPLTPAEIRAL